MKIPETYSGVAVATLIFGEILETLGFVTDTTSEFNSLAADTVPASGIGTAGERLCTLCDHGVAEHVDLSLGKGALHADLFADGALDPEGVSCGFWLGIGRLTCQGSQHCRAW